MIHSMFRSEISALADRMVLLAVRKKNPEWQLTVILDVQKWQKSVATGLPIDVMFGFRMGFPAELRFLPPGPSYVHALLSRVTFESAAPFVVLVFVNWKKNTGRYRLN